MKQLIDLLKATPIERMEGNSQVRIIDVTADSRVADTRKAMEDIVPYFFDYPSKKMRMIALTGTNGKTTTTHVISHILHRVGYKTGVIGTVHVLIGDKAIPTHNTTPDVIV
ncbi:Mur ligase family protein, partial [Dialister invisus]|uniref:Mur ligase family protein n=1 Tax=Dialister invisus TaxID=218538 RepID=UPI003FD7639A